jgi:hypothetical protein
MIIMSLTEHEMTLAVMDNDGFGCAITTTPRPWLRERVNDGYGTDNRHPFWATVDFERIGSWKVFQRDGAWYGYETRQNAWTTARPTRDDVISIATAPRIDIWA